MRDSYQRRGRNIKTFRPTTPLPINPVLLNNRMVVGVDCGDWAMQQPEASRALIGEVVAMAGDRRLRRPEAAPRRLDEVREVLAVPEGRRVTGKGRPCPVKGDGQTSQGRGRA